MRSLFRLLAPAAVAVTLATAAGAATYDFGGVGSGDTLLTSKTYLPSVGNGPSILVEAFSTGILNGGQPTIWEGPSGLGVNGRPDLQPALIDGRPVLSGESLKVTFGWAVNLIGILLGEWDGNDDAVFCVEQQLLGETCLLASDVIVNGNQSWTNILLDKVLSFEVFAFGEIGEGLFGNDDFTLKAIQTAEVPLPASFVLMLGALGGLGVVVRRRTTAA